MQDMEQRRVRQESQPKPRAPLNINLERRAQIGQEKRARTRTALLDSAFTLLGRENGRNTRIEEICGESGISRATFYNYFNNMDEVFSALSDELNHDFNRAVTRIISALPTAAERAGAAVRYYLERALHDPKWGWAMVNISAGGPIFGQDTYEHAQATADEGIATGEFEIPGPHTGRDIQLGTTHAAMITQLRNQPSPTFAASIARHVLLALGVPKARADEVVAQDLPDPLPGDF
ncbi:MAG: TetR/AcrR family transcriptional regulator [Sphingopyxis sp.]|uniref:TetR/AcrR family transcriptional regulator n=1 Tax=Sphingopyxis sp. TaxID=1908224 RepID=UPI003D6CB7F0